MIRRPSPPAREGASLEAGKVQTTGGKWLTWGGWQPPARGAPSGPSAGQGAAPSSPRSSLPRQPSAWAPQGRLPGETQLAQKGRFWGEGSRLPPRPSSSLHTHRDSPSFCVCDCSLRFLGAGCWHGGCPRAGQAGPRPWELGVGGEGRSAGEDTGEGVQGEDTWLSPGAHEGLRRPRWAGRKAEPAPRWVGALGRAGASSSGRQRAGRGTSKPAWAAPSPPPGARPCQLLFGTRVWPRPRALLFLQTWERRGSGPVLPRPLWLLPKDALEGRAAACRGRWQVSDAGRVLKAA